MKKMLVCKRGKINGPGENRTSDLAFKLWNPLPWPTEPACATVWKSERADYKQVSRPHCLVSAPNFIFLVSNFLKSCVGFGSTLRPLLISKSCTGNINNIQGYQSIGNIIPNAMVVVLRSNFSVLEKP